MIQACTQRLTNAGTITLSVMESQMKSKFYDCCRIKSQLYENAFLKMRFILFNQVMGLCDTDVDYKSSNFHSFCGHIR